jgi:transforming growth factor-beta-induced protein
MSTTNNFIRTISSAKFCLLSAVLVASLSSCEDDFKVPEPPSGNSITATAMAGDNFNILATALTKTGIAAALNDNNAGQFTVFAPNDAAFLSYAQGLFGAPTLTESEAIAKINALTNISSPSITTLAGVLNYHIVSSRILSSAITGAQTFSTLQGARLSLSNDAGVITVNGNIGSNGASVVSKDIEASNGVIHEINKVMTALGTANNILTKFSMGVNYAVAPAVVTGGLETGGDAITTDFDLMAYAIRKSNYAFTLVPNATPLPEFTIFAPTDLAFRTYITSLDPAVTTEAQAIAFLKNMSEDAVAQIVKYHVLPGRYLSSDLTNGKSVATALEGKNIGVNIVGTDVFITDNNAAADPRVTAANSAIYNDGVAHTINGVLRAN